MKSFIAFAAVLAVASAQFFNTQPGRYNPRPALAYPQPTLAYPQPTFPAPRVVPVVTARPVVVSRVASSDQAANVLRYDNDVGPDGSFSYAVETDNGISAQAQGTPKAFGGNPPVAPVVSTGSFSWTSPEGQPISITYVADENGYQPSGSAIPTPPAIPEAIARSIEYNLRNQK